TARLQEIGAEGGGSVIEMGDPEERTLAGQLAFAPAALVAAFFRPFIFEVKNPLMLLPALETTALLVVFVRTLWVSTWGKTWRLVWSSPILMFCTVFSLLSGVAVGLSTVNLGALSRYRLPLMPFYVALVVITSSGRLLERARGE